MSKNVDIKDPSVTVNSDSDAFLWTNDLIIDLKLILAGGVSQQNP
jgi:hypothetical protein